MQNEQSIRIGKPASSIEISQRDPMTAAIIAAAIEVHRELGPGLLESTYETCLCWELARANIPHLRQHDRPVIYKGERVECGYRLDILVQDRVVVELKAVDAITDVHKAQLLTYMKLGGYSVGLLINFNVRLLKHGLIRMVL